MKCWGRNKYGQLGAADGPAVSHVFRIEGGKIVYVHTLMAKQGS